MNNAISPSIRPLTFGGCLLNNLIAALNQNDRVGGLFKEMGFKRTPFTISAASAAQLLDFITGHIVIPPHVRRFCYLDAEHVPSGPQRDVAFTADFCMVEMSTSVDIVYDGFILNTNRFEQFILPELAHLNLPPRLVAKWRSALVKQNEPSRAKHAEELLRLIPETESLAWIHDLVARTSSRELDVDQMTSHIGRIKETLNVPLVMIHHNFRYMPDGRPISWPVNLKDQSIEVAQRLGAVEFDFAPFVAEHGASVVLAEDLRHWNPKFFPQIANHLYGFICKTTGREAVVIPPSDKGIDFLALEDDEVAAEIADGTKPQSDKTAAARSLPKTKQAAGVDAEKARRVAAKEIVKPRAPVWPKFDINALAYHHPSATHFDFDPNVLNMVLVVGQSWALGGNNDEAGDGPATSAPEHPGHALMFDAGSAPRGRRISGLVDLFERASGSTKETPCSGLANYMMSTCQERFGRKPTVVFAAVGRGGTTLSGAGQDAADGLLRGSPQHLEAMRLVTRAVELAAAKSQTVRVLAICLAHGESDAGRRTAAEVYSRGMILLRQHYEADIRKLTGQVDGIPMLAYQANRGASRLGQIAGSVKAQLDVTQLDAGIRCIGPVYNYEPEVRSHVRVAHLKALGYRHIGMQFGRFLLDDLFGPGVEPLRVTAARWLRTDVVGLEYTHDIALEENDDRVNISNLGPGLGIEFARLSSRSPAIESISVSARDPKLLEIKFSGSLARAGGQLFIAARFTGANNCGRHEGARSGIRSKQPYYTDPREGTELYDWACTQVVGIAALESR